MTGLSNQRVTLGQGDGSEIELVVSGTEVYATYETIDGFAVVYDADLELFCYARLEDGRLVSTGVPASAPPPPGLTPHARESDEVRESRIEQRSAQMDRSSTTSNEEDGR